MSGVELQGVTGTLEISIPIPNANRRQQSRLSAAVHASTRLPDHAHLTLRASPAPPAGPPSDFVPCRGVPSGARTHPGAQLLLLIGEPLPVPAVHHPHGRHDLRRNRLELPRSRRAYIPVYAPIRRLFPGQA
jgi:hypothetical protein